MDDLTYWATQVGDDYWAEYLTNEAHDRSRLIVEALQQLDLPNNLSLHEFGCGLGRNLWHIHQAFPTWELYGNDVNAQAKERMKEAWPSMNVYYVGGPSEHTVRYMDHLDILLSVAHFIHIDDMTPFLEHIPQLLNPGGYLVLYESGGTLSPQDAEYWADHAPGWYDHDHLALWTDAGLTLVTHKAGVKSMGSVHGTRRYDLLVFRKDSA